MSSAITAAARPHSKLSPSMMGRVEKCTASYFLAPPDTGVRESTEAAAYGTAAHDIADRLLKDPDAMSVEYLDTDISADGFEFVVDDEMLNSIDIYTDVCRDLQGRYANTLVEKRMSLAGVFADRPDAKEIAGLVDFAAFDPAQEVPYVIVDYKSGYMPVGSEALQVILYGLMLVGFVGGGVKLRKGSQPLLETIVVQPKDDGDPVRRRVWTADEVGELRIRVRDLLDAISRRNFYYGVGDHCAFCPIVGVCPHLRAVAQDAALADVVPDAQMIVDGVVKVEDIDDDLLLIPLLEKWIKARVGLAESYLTNGGHLENAALRRKRSNRRWLDEAAAEAYMKKHGVSPHGEPKLKSPNQAEQSLAPVARAGLKPLWEKPVGDLTIAIGKVADKDRINLSESLKRVQEQNLAGRLLRKADGVG